MTARTHPIGAKQHNASQSQNVGGTHSLFAQPLYASKFPVPSKVSARSDAAWPRRAVWTLGVLVCGALLALARPDGAQNLPATRNATSPAPAATNRTPATGPNTNAASAPLAAQTTQQLLDAPEESRRTVDFYTQTVRGNLFNAPQPPAQKPVYVAPPKPEKPIPVPPAPIPSPFASWSYTGTVTMGDQTIGLLENTQTKDGQYVKAGDNFMGAQVVSVTDQMVTLKSGKTPTLLAKSDNITVTPLDRSAAPTSANQQNQGPQNPAQQLTNAIMSLQSQNQPQQPMVTMPNGRQMQQQRFQRMQQRLNRNFNQ